MHLISQFKSPIRTRLVDAQHVISTSWTMVSKAIPRVPKVHSTTSNLALSAELPAHRAALFGVRTVIEIAVQRGSGLELFLCKPSWPAELPSTTRLRPTFQCAY